MVCVALLHFTAKFRTCVPVAPPCAGCGSTGWLQDFIAAAQKLGYGNYFFKYSTAITDDQVPFRKVGIPVVDVVDATFGPMSAPNDGMGADHHTNQDTLHKVSEHSLMVVGRTILLAVETLDRQSG